MSTEFNPFCLDGKTVVVTGASSGIGRECAIGCSRMGARLVLVARNEERLKETMSQLDGCGHIYVLADLANPECVTAAADKILSEIGKVDGLVNCAGISATLSLKQTIHARLEEYFRANVCSALDLTRELANVRHMNPGGSIVFMSSIMACVGESGKTLYSMTKGALLAAMRSLACELSKRSVRVNCISPGAIETPINAKLPHMSDPDQRKQLEDKHLLGLGRTEDIANGVVYLVSDASRWITGQNIIIDGGYTAR